MLPFLAELQEFIKHLNKTSGVRTQPWPLFILGLALFVLALLFMPLQVLGAVSIALFMAPLWLPFLIVGGAWGLWVILKRSEFISSQKYILLEIQPPRSLVKTPLAMEAVLSGIHLNPGEGNWYKKYILGAVRPWWSLEIVSLEGQVHFFIWTRAGFRRQIESQIYAQYPGAAVVEAPDYSRTISALPEEWGVWGCDFEHTKADPYPIKTYVEYGLDKTQKEPEQTDPLANLIEFMGSMGKGEYLWLQLVIRVHKGEQYGHGKTWKDIASEEIKKIREASVLKMRTVDIGSGKTIEVPLANPTKGQSEAMAAIERNISKQAFDVGARAIYIAKPDRFDGIAIAGLTGLFKQFSSEGWNGFKPSGWMTAFEDYPWEIGATKLKNLFREALIDAYRRRQFFFEPYAFPPKMVMSTEELATLYHIPSAAIPAPALPRIQSATAEAPTNLPV